MYSIIQYNTIRYNTHYWTINATHQSPSLTYFNILVDSRIQFRQLYPWWIHNDHPLKPIATKDLPSNTKLTPTSKYDPTINDGISASSLGAPVSALSPSTFPMNAPAGIPGMNSVGGNDQAGAGSGGSSGGAGENKCPPCPACARCPEPAFECKKVPNYSRSEDVNAPRPVMADFSQFGM